MKNTKILHLAFVLFILPFLVSCLAAPPQPARAHEFAYSEQYEPFSREELAQMLAPIALYPDPLLTQILMAATYPIEVIEADRWLRENPNLSGTVLDATLLDQDWAPSVMALCHFPEILALMSERISETTDLGNAFLVQEAEVMAMIQELRAQAHARGNLNTTVRQQVIVEKETIIIQPADPTVVYVPYYDPLAVYGPWWYPAYPPYYWGPPGDRSVVGVSYWPGFYFGFAFGTWSYFDWHHHTIHVDVHKRPRFVKHDRWYKKSGRWHHSRHHRRGVAYRDQSNYRKHGHPARHRGDDRRERERRVERGDERREREDGRHIRSGRWNARVLDGDRRVKMPTTRDRKRLEDEHSRTDRERHNRNQVKPRSQRRASEEQGRLNGERVDRERQQRVRVERERRNREQADRQRQQRVRVEQERRNREQVDRERQQRVRVERERRNRERVDRERQQRVRVEQERRNREQADRQRQQRVRAEQERRNREQADRQRQQRVRVEQERRNRDRVDRQRQQRVRVEQERRNREQADRQRQQRVRAEQERRNREQADRQRQQRVRAEQERRNRDRVDRQRQQRAKTSVVKQGKKERREIFSGRSGEFRRQEDHGIRARGGRQDDRHRNNRGNGVQNQRGRNWR